MNNLLQKIIILIILILVNTSCQVSIEDKNSEYKTNIYRWFAKNHHQIEFEKSQWMLYFDDLLTCKACKLDILSKIKSNKDIVIITRFSENIEVNMFRESYSLNNLIINVRPNPSEKLSVPFLFLKEGKTMKNLLILNDDELEEGEWWSNIDRH